MQQKQASSRGKLTLLLSRGLSNWHTSASLRILGSVASRKAPGASGSKNITGDSNMQKKLMAIAVAGALGAPAVALAQASTVQVYGQITYEYGIANQGDAVGGSRPNVDYADTPGGSAIGFRGEEK